MSGLQAERQQKNNNGRAKKNTTRRAKKVVMETEDAAECGLEDSLFIDAHFAHDDSEMVDRANRTENKT